MLYSSRKILVGAKAYPVIDQRSLTEAVCVAGISVGDTPRWARLFPLDFRGLDLEQKFPKYSVIEFNAIKAKGDPRPESVTPDMDSINVVEHIDPDGGSWQRRLALLRRVESPSMCELQRQVGGGSPTLGVFRVKSVIDIELEEQPGSFTESQTAVQAQTSILGGRAANGDRMALEPIPTKFKYRYFCHDSRCKGHTQTIVDWELGALYRRLTPAYDIPEVNDRVREKFLEQLCGSEREVWFVVGTMLKHRTSFIVLSVVSPLKDRIERSGTLFV